MSDTPPPPPGMPPIPPPPPPPGFGSRENEEKIDDSIAEDLDDNLDMNEIAQFIDDLPTTDAAEPPLPLPPELDAPPPLPPNFEPTPHILPNSLHLLLLVFHLSKKMLR